MSASKASSLLSISCPSFPRFGQRGRLFAFDRYIDIISRVTWPLPR